MNKRQREAAEYLRDWVEHKMPLRVDSSLPSDVLTALDILGNPLRLSEFWTENGYPIPVYKSDDPSTDGVTLINGMRDQEGA